MQGHYGAAVDIGTTTIALLLYNLYTGICIGPANMQPPKTAVAADVIGRIEASLNQRSFYLVNSEAALPSDKILRIAKLSIYHSSYSDSTSLHLTGWILTPEGMLE